MRNMDSAAETTGGGASLPCADSAEMGRLLARLEPRLAAVARRLTRDPAAAADVVQNTFEKVLRRCEEFRGGALATTWMHRIVVNESFQWLRRERRHRRGRIDPGDWGLVSGTAPEPSQLLETGQDHARVRRALALLPRLDRALIEGSMEGERTYAEMGRELGLSEGAVKSRIRRARDRLERELGDR
jgi:RNA polymerase sigma factor (sigma-70 family)